MILAANKPKHYDGSYINIVTWNVQGLVKDTVDDTMFLSCVNNNDVIILTETWLQGEILWPRTPFQRSPYTCDSLDAFSLRSVQFTPAHDNAILSMLFLFARYNSLLPMLMLLFYYFCFPHGIIPRTTHPRTFGIY